MMAVVNTGDRADRSGVAWIAEPRERAQEDHEHFYDFQRDWKSKTTATVTVREKERLNSHLSV
jgi:hypothetical protein